MFTCSLCGIVYDEPELEECQHCGLRFCSSCSAVDLAGRFCTKCGEFIKEKIYGNKDFHITLPEPDIAKREQLHLKFKNIDLKDRHPLHISFNENKLDGYTRMPMHLSIPETLKPKETLLMKFPELLMGPSKHEMHLKFEDHTLLHKKRIEPLHMAFPENFLRKDIITDMALKIQK